jgi:hypothetical protein
MTDTETSPPAAAPPTAREPAAPPTAPGPFAPPPGRTPPSMPAWLRATIDLSLAAVMMTCDAGLYLSGGRMWTTACTVGTAMAVACVLLSSRRVAKWALLPLAWALLPLVWWRWTVLVRRARASPARARLVDGPPPHPALTAQVLTAMEGAVRALEALGFAEVARTLVENGADGGSLYWITLVRAHDGAEAAVTASLLAMRPGVTPRPAEVAVGVVSEYEPKDAGEPWRVAASNATTRRPAREPRTQSLRLPGASPSLLAHAHDGLVALFERHRTTAGLSPLRRRTAPTTPEAVPRRSEEDAAARLHRWVSRGEWEDAPGAPGTCRPALPTAIRLAARHAHPLKGVLAWAERRRVKRRAGEVGVEWRGGEWLVLETQ